MHICHVSCIFVCSDEPRQCEPLDAPAGSQPGDRVRVESYETGEPDAVLNPKKKVWETLQGDLRVSVNGIAEWQGNALQTERGSITTKIIKNVPIK
jgi:tyrosyl-tRNA synthetase